MIEASKPEDDPLTYKGERLGELIRRAHAEWEPWLVDMPEESSPQQTPSETESVLPS